MPVMDGIEFSATTLLNGASDYILKPMLNPESLLKTLKKAAGRIPGLKLKRGGKDPVLISLSAI